MKRLPFHVLLASALTLGACGSSNGSAADRVGVGAMCTTASDCLQPNPPCDSGAGCFNQQCLTQFSGGYCGIANCTSNLDCPTGSACVAHTDGINYCFRQCVDKSECNINRDAAHESNCSANVVFVDPSTPGKACVPPSSGP